MKLLLSTDKIFAAVIALLLLSITAVLVISISESRQVQQASKMVDHTEQVLIHTERLLIAIKDNESASRGFTLTGEPVFLQHLNESKQAVEQELSTLRQLTTDNQDQQHLLDTLSSYINERIRFSDNTISSYHQAGQEAAMEAVRTGKGRELSAGVRQTIDSIRSVESELLAKRKEINEQKTSRLNYILGITVVAILVLTGFFVQKIRSDFTERKQAAISLASMNDELEQRVKKRTHELAESNKTLEQTFERIRSIMNSALDGIISIDEAGLISFWNPQAEKIFGWRADEITGQSLTDTIIPPQYREMHRKGMEHYLLTGEGRVLNKLIEISAINRSGTEFPVELTIIPIQHNGTVSFTAFIRDISQRKKAEQELRDSEAKYRLLIERISDAFIAIDKNWRYTYANKAVGELVGRDPASLIGKNVWEEFPEAVGSATYKLFHQAMEEQHYLSNEDYFEPFDLWQENHIYPSPDGISVFIKNITERKKAEEKILKANRLYFFISQVNQMIVRTTNQETLFKEACRIAVELGKFSLAWIGLVDETSESVVPVVFAGEENKYLSEIKPISIQDIPEGHGPTGKAIRNDQYYICNDIENDPSMIPWKDAALSRGYRSSMALPIKKFGKVIGAFSFYSPAKNFFDDSEIALLEEATGDVGFALEVIEKEEMRQRAEQGIAESERRYHTLAEVSPVGIFHTDATGYTTYVNPRWCQISGLTYEKALGDGWFEAVHPDDRDMLRRSWEEATRQQQVSVSEYRFIRPNGSTAWVIGQAIPERDTDGTIVGYVGTTTDITDRKLAEKEMEESSQKLRELTTHLLNIREEERKRIGREIHDELGQQLTAIKMDVSWIAKKADPDNQAFKTKLQNVISLLDGGNHSIRRILNELRPVILDDYGLLEALRWHGQQFTANTGIPVALTASETDLRIPEEISTCIFRVFQEALTNITRYAKATQVKVSLDIDQDSVLLNIEDNGQGFDTGLIKSKKSFGILGMKERVASLNGRFDLSSEIGKGTRISIHIPIKPKTTDPVS